MMRLKLCRGFIFAVLGIMPLSVQARYSDAYVEAGGVYTMLFQPSLGYWWGDYGIRIGGMYQDRLHQEYHLNMGYLLSDDEEVQQAVNLLTSKVVGSDPGAHYDYMATGIAYSINYQGFFFELGVAVPWQDNLGNVAKDYLIPSGQIGYIYRFH